MEDDLLGGLIDGGGGTELMLDALGCAADGTELAETADGV